MQQRSVYARCVWILRVTIQTENHRKSSECGNSHIFERNRNAEFFQSLNDIRKEPVMIYTFVTRRINRFEVREIRRFNTVIIVQACPI